MYNAGWFKSKYGVIDNLFNGKCNVPSKFNNEPHFYVASHYKSRLIIDSVIFGFYKGSVWCRN